MAGFSIPDFLTIAMSFIFGVIFIFFSRHKGSFEKTSAAQGLDTAIKKFKIISLCGYFLIIGSVIYTILLLLA